MIFFELLNRTFERDRDGTSTYGARPLSAHRTTPSAKSRIDPRVFLSFGVRVTLLDAFFVFFAMTVQNQPVTRGLLLNFVLLSTTQFVLINDQNIFTKVGFDGIHLLAAIIQHGVGFRG